MVISINLSPIGAWKSNFLVNYDKPTDQPSNQQIDYPTDGRGIYWVVTLSIIELKNIIS